MKKVLMVCLGNICRSPMAEGVLRAKATESHIELEIDSCGTSSYHIGEAPDIRAIENLSRRGIDISGLRARQFQSSDFAEFDHIFVMDESNLQNILDLTNSEQDSDKVSLFLNEISQKNASVPDPYFGGPDGFDHVFDLLDEACEAFLQKNKD